MTIIIATLSSVSSYILKLYQTKFHAGRSEHIQVLWSVLVHRKQVTERLDSYVVGTACMHFYTSSEYIEVHETCYWLATRAQLVANISRSQQMLQQLQLHIKVHQPTNNRCENEQLYASHKSASFNACSPVLDVQRSCLPSPFYDYYNAVLSVCQLLFISQAYVIPATKFQDVIQCKDLQRVFSRLGR